MGRDDHAFRVEQSRGLYHCHAEKVTLGFNAVRRQVTAVPSICGSTMPADTGSRYGTPLTARAVICEMNPSSVVVVLTGASPVSELSAGIVLGASTPGIGVIVTEPSVTSEDLVMLIDSLAWNSADEEGPVR